MKPNAFVLAALMLAALPGAARAQEVNLAAVADGGANRVYLRTGAEFGFVAGVGYVRTVDVLGRNLLVGADLTAPWASPDASDYRGRLSALVPIVELRRWRLAGSLAPTVRRTNNDVARMTSAGVDLGVVGGYYRPHWFVAGEAGFDWAMSTHVAHGDEYRSSVYAGARDGWYANPGGNLRYGAQTGATFGRHELALRLGQLIDVAGEAPLLPFYGTVSFATRW